MISETEFLYTLIECCIFSFFPTQPASCIIYSSNSYNFVFKVWKCFWL